LITKIDTAGNVAWEKQYKMIRGGEANSIKKVYSGYVVQGITGYTFNPYLTAYPYFIRINTLGDTIFVKTFPDDTLTFIARFNVINPNRYVIGCTFDSIEAQTHDEKFMITDSVGSVIYRKNFHSVDYMDIYSILPLPNGDILSVGLIDNGTNTFEDVYAMRTDSMLNAPPIGIKPISNKIPSLFNLSQNYPNPFNPKTKIKFEIPTPLRPPFNQRGDGVAGGFLVLLKIYDLLGREISTLVNQGLKPGTYEVEFDGSNFASGIYFYRLITSNFTETKKMVLLK
jgi:hypothetical protein